MFLYTSCSSVHVVLVMVSYTLLFCIALLSVRCLLHGCTPATLTRLTALSRLLLYPAVSFLASGIIAGAVWANISWMGWFDGEGGKAARAAGAGRPPSGLKFIGMDGGLCLPAYSV